MTYRKLVFFLSVSILILSLIATLGGLLIPSLYQDNDAFVRNWKNTDLVTLVVAIPLFCFVLYKSLFKLTPRLLMSWIGLLWFFCYNYAYYVFGTFFNDFYMIYVAIYSLSIPAIIYGVIDMVKLRVLHNEDKKVPYFLVAGYMLFVSFGLTFVYVLQWIQYIATDELPVIVTSSEHVTSIVFSLDISMVVVFFVMTAIYLIKKRPIGIAFAWILNVKGLLYMMVLSYVSLRAGFSETGLWLTLGLLSLIVLIVLRSHINTELIKDRKDSL